MKLKLVIYNGARYQGYSEAELKALNIPDAIILTAKENQILMDVQDARKLSYKNESDPLFLEWQYDQSSEKEQAWRDKVAEIKIRYPLPTAQ
ncbi:hypothetical protein [Photobacterium iliopiscarium]|uniref:Uncharacterized protein n=1 Tax=Photobacterium iliopiscarium TaxID=56192 RepID=A0A2T3MNK2_9GAMM|nr:hypothetical protein [Photobacterium iliopiscarium]PSV98297.1 hypothetical protein C9I88_06435 [Photobacterium iliopiscarium]